MSILRWIRDRWASHRRHIQATSKAGYRNLHTPPRPKR